MRLEDVEQQIFCKYMNDKYPKLIFLSDGSGLPMTTGQRIKWRKMRSDNGFPDLMIFKAKGGFHGCFIELKKTDEKVVNNKGVPVSDHVMEQLTMIDRLTKEGYYARMCVGLEQAKACIDSYMALSDF
jgi:hypothetical protein